MARGRNTIAQRIALDGGKEIEAELKALGAVGEEAFRRLKKAAEQVGKESFVSRAVADAKKDLQSLGDQAKKVTASVKSMTDGFGRFGNALQTIGSRVTTAFKVVGTAAAGAGVAIGAAVKTGADQVDALADKAEGLQLSIEAFSKYSFAAKLAGESGDVFEQSLNKLNVKLGEVGAALDKNKNNVSNFSEVINSTFKEVQDETDKTAAMFSKLGIRLRDASGQMKPTEEVLKDLADVFASMEDGPQKSAIAFELFGKAGMKMIPFLNMGRAGIEQLAAEAERLGLVFTESDKKIASTFNDKLDTLGSVLAALRTRIALLVMPKATAFIEILTNKLADMREEILALSERVMKKAVVIAADFYDAIWGDPTQVANPWVLEWVQGFREFSTGCVQAAKAVQVAFSDVIIPAFRLVGETLDWLAQKLNDTFGTNFSGQSLAVVILAGKLLGVFGLLAPAVSTAASAFKILFDLLKLGGGLFALIAKHAGGLLVLLARFVGWPRLIAAAIGAAAVAIVQNWDEIKQGAQALWDFVSKIFSGDWSGAWNTFKTAAAEAWAYVKNLSAGELAAIAFAAATSWGTVRKLGVEAAKLIGAAFGSIGGPSLFAGLASAAGAAFRGIVAAAGLAARGIALAFAALATPGGAIALVGAAIGALLVIYWDEIKAGATAVAEWIAQKFSDAVTAIGEFFAGVGETMAAGWQVIKDGAADAWSWATAKASEAWDAIRSLFTAETVLAIWQAFKDAAQSAWDLVRALFSADRMMGLWQGIAEAANAAWQIVKNGATAAADWIITKMKNAIGWITDAISKLASFIGLGNEVESGGEQQFASGGYVRGPGTATSDSIRAWLSNGEFVQRAKAVSFWGRSFMEAINRLDLKAVRRMLSNGFAKGGYVSVPSFKAGLPAFSGGGLVDGLTSALASMMPAPMAVALPAMAGSTGDLRPVNLTIGGETVPMQAAEPAIQQLARIANRKKLASGGRKPNWVR